MTVSRETLLPAYFGEFGGQFVPESLIPALDQLEKAFVEAQNDPAFRKELSALLRDYLGRPTPITEARNLGGKARIFLKREDLVHGGAHKTNQVLGQALLAKRMGKTRIIAETGAGQHGTATALACALLDLECVVYMGAKDVARQQPNEFRMELMGAKVVAVDTGSGTLKDAVNEALRDWTATFHESHYLLGSNAIGMFAEFIEEEEVELVGAEPGGEGLDSGKHGATINNGTVGILHGARSYLMRNADGQVEESYSISAGLDYPGVGPQHAHLHASGRAHYVGITDAEALEAFQLLSTKEGIIPALESSHALAYALKRKDEDITILVSLSGRGDKDIDYVRHTLENHPEFKLQEKN